MINENTILGMLSNSGYSFSVPGVVYCVNTDVNILDIKSRYSFELRSVSIDSFPTMIVARRIGLQNVERDDYLVFYYEKQSIGQLEREIHSFCRMLAWDNDGPGNKFLSRCIEFRSTMPLSYSSVGCNDTVERETPNVESHPACQSIPKRSFRDRLGSFLFSKDESEQFCGEDIDIFNEQSVGPDTDEIEVEELEQKRQAILEQIRRLIVDYVVSCHEMPDLDKLSREIDGVIILGNKDASPIHVNNNLDIVFPDYDEITLKLSPQLKAVYLLFLSHPDGIVLKQIGEYENELREILSILRPTADEARYDLFVEEIIRPGGDLLRQKISQIKRAVSSHFSESNLVDHYAITGRRGEPYIIAAARDARLPRALNFNTLA